MSETTILQILLFAQALVLGSLVTLAVQYYRRHYGSSYHETEILHPIDPEEVLSPEVKQRLIEESELKIQSALNSTAHKLNSDLDVSAVEINRLVKRLATDIVSGEMERYRLQLGQLHEQADKQMGVIREEVAKYEETIKARIDQELTAERQKLVTQIDTKLADAVASFLNETLQHNVDLGGQTEYLLSMLEEHKADFIREVGSDETKSAA
jgi:hypothetical protein